MFLFLFVSRFPLSCERLHVTTYTFIFKFFRYAIHIMCNKYKMECVFKKGTFTLFDIYMYKKTVFSKGVKKCS